MTKGIEKHITIIISIIWKFQIIRFCRVCRGLRNKKCHRSWKLQFNLWYKEHLRLRHILKQSYLFVCFASWFAFKSRNKEMSVMGTKFLFICCPVLPELLEPNTHWIDSVEKKTKSNAPANVTAWHFCTYCHYCDWFVVFTIRVESKGKIEVNSDASRNFFDCRRDIKLVKWPRHSHSSPAVTSQSRVMCTSKVIDRVSFTSADCSDWFPFTELTEYLGIVKWCFQLKCS